MAKLTPRPKGPVLARVAGRTVLAGTLLVSGCGADAVNQAEPEAPVGGGATESAAAAPTESAPPEPEAEGTDGEPSASDEPDRPVGQMVGDEMLVMPYRQ